MAEPAVEEERVTVAQYPVRWEPYTQTLMGITEGLDTGVWS